jgi:uroporphyrinogen-III decarboxylase
MSSKERILAAMRGEPADSVPVQAGVGSMAPRRLDMPYWDIYFGGKKPLWKAVIDINRYYGLDGYVYMSPQYSGPDPDDQRRLESRIVRQNDDFVVRRITFHTPDGDLWEETTCPRYDQPTPTVGLIKSVDDFHLYLKYWFSENPKYSDEALNAAKAMMGQEGAVAASFWLPGMHDLMMLFEGKLETAAYFFMDYPELIEEYREKSEKAILRCLAYYLDAKPDYVEISASGMLTLSKPEWLCQHSIPTLRKITAMCDEAGIPTELHCCGKAAFVVETVANETTVMSVNPLQPPPMGDCDLAEIKRVFGKRLCLKGNVGVTEPMLNGTPDAVEKDVLRCLEAAKAGGRYILFTEEGLGRDTPDANLRRYVAVGRANGKY